MQTDNTMCQWAYPGKMMKNKIDKCVFLPQQI